MSYRFLLSICLAPLGLAAAGWGQADGKIAFLSDREGHQDVWIMDADGSDPVNLTQGQNCASPAWSPDGAKIAYIGDVFADGQYGGEIWLMDADGGNPQPLTDDSVKKMSLWWSEDGSSIYYTVPDREKRVGFDVFVMALDGNGSSPVEWRESLFDLFFTRSPDGTKLAAVVLVDEEGKAHLYVRDMSEYQRPNLSQIQLDLWGTPLPDLPQQGDPQPGRLTTSYLAWSPDSMRIVFDAYTGQTVDDHENEIWAVDLDGSNLVNLTNGLGGRSPTWQPATPSAAATNVEAQSWGQVKSLVAAP